MLQTMRMRLGVFYEKARVVLSLSFLQLQMLVIINMFMVKNKEMCNQNVVMQRLYNDDNWPSDHYSKFESEEYKSDDECEEVEEDGMKKLVVPVPIDYFSLVFEFVLRWPLISKD